MAELSERTAISDPIFVEFISKVHFFQKKNNKREMQSKDFKVIERQNTCLENSDQTKQGRLWRRLYWDLSQYQLNLNSPERQLLTWRNCSFRIGDQFYLNSGAVMYLYS